MARPREFDPDQALDQAMHEFWLRGYRATSVEDLVRATGVKPGSLYGAFPGGKRSLFLNSLSRYSKLIVPQNLRLLEQPGASLPELRATFDAFVADLITEEGRQGCLLVNSAVELGATDAEVAAVVRGHHARLESNFAHALANAKRDGLVNAGLDVAGAAKVLVATSQGLMVVGKANPDEGVLKTIVDNAFAALA